MNILLSCMYVHHMHTWSPEESIRSSGTGVSYGPATCRCWELNPLQKKQVSTLELLRYFSIPQNIIYLRDLLALVDLELSKIYLPLLRECWD